MAGAEAVPRGGGEQVGAPSSVCSTARPDAEAIVVAAMKAMVSPGDAPPMPSAIASSGAIGNAQCSEL